MATPKRRKLETAGSAQPMSAASAFALRRQLLTGNGASVPAPSTPDPTPGPGDVPMSPGPAAAPLPRARRTREGKGDGARTPVSAASSSATSVVGRGPVVGEDGDILPTSSTATAIASPLLKQYSTFRANKSNSRRLPSGVLQLKLSESERFVILGSFGVRVNTGEVTLAGATLGPSEAPFWVHAAQCHALPVLRCSEATKLEIHPHPSSSKLRQLERLSPLFRSLWNDAPKEEDPSSRLDTFQLIYTSQDIPRKSFVQELVAHPAWNKKLAELTADRDGKASVIFLTGPKSSGKSTFGRILGNRLLTSQSKSNKRQPAAVVVMDLDPGQPEYNPAGTIALVQVKTPNLCPPFAHAPPDAAAASILRLHATAAVSPASDPELYIEAALDLYHRYQQSAVRNRPLIINTPGWILGTGLDLLTELISRIAPTDVIYMSEDGPYESVEGIKAAAKKTFASLPSQQSDFASRTAAHLRSMQTMAYFHTSITATGSTSWEPSPLSTMPPLMVKFAGDCPGILGILSYDFQPPADLLAETINGAILAIVEIEDDAAFESIISADNPSSGMRQPGIARSPEGIPIILNPDSETLRPGASHCLGIALLRGIDVQDKSLQLLTPVPLSRIQESRVIGRQLVLLHGKFDTPGWAYTEDLYARSYTEGSGTGDDLWQADDDDGGGEDSGEGRLAGLSADVTVQQATSETVEIPWVEVLRDNEKRPVGSRAWRVRRDLGKGGPGGD
ncbi:GRC3 protein [Plectosphaerella plurivora]|uniref:Polynucleotide 5'-hydroxyl-kinase GRC3 n=1 Tax=Plectosphaerella plurivora TaxID=936078 RepID=A0A9P8VBK8_9PEZI|nr:GRC3 protein [Plectosphaerella plurivora]